MTDLESADPRAPMTDVQSVDARQSDRLLVIERAPDREGVTLSLVGELDLSSVPELEGELSEIGTDRVGRVLLDLSRLRFMDSTGLASLLRADECARTNGHKLHLRRPSPQVRRLLELTGAVDRLAFEE